MKITTLLASLIFFASFLTSCQKEIDDSIPGTDSNNTSNPFLVKSYTEDTYLASVPDEHVKDSFKLTYDDKDRLLSLISVDTSDGNRFAYQYGDGYFIMDLYVDNQLSIHETFYLNSYSLVDSTLQYDGDEHDTSTEKYTYNSNKQLLSIKTYDYTTESGAQLSSTSTLAYDNDGNVVTETEDDATTTYAYPNHTINNLNVGLNYYPLSKYLPDTFTYTSDFYTDSGTHTYTFDSQNRLTMDKTESASGYISIKRYYY